MAAGGLMGAVKVKKPSEFRKDLYNDLKQTSKGKQIIIPHKDGQAILMDHESFEALHEDLQTQQDIIQGLNDLREGRSTSLEEVIRSGPWKEK